MRLLRKSLSLILALTVILTCFAYVSVSAADGKPENYKRKVVSIVYDDSGSMKDSIGTNSSSRYSYARYAIQMLMALMDPRDTLDIMPMNTGKINVDLANDRNNVVKSTVGLKMFTNPSGNTPASSVLNAVNQLVSRGMKKSADMITSEDDVEYWLIILTDGEFENGRVSIQKILNDYVISQGYNSLRTIYLAFGSAAADISNDTTIGTKIPFTAYKATDNIADIMQQIAAQLSGRYKSDAGIVASGKKVAINLSNGYSMNNISVIAQNLGTGGSLVSATYNGAPVLIEQGCEIDSSGISVVSNGYSAVIKPKSGYFSEGKLELEFSNSIDPKYLSILVEPSIYIKPYIIYKGSGGASEITPQYLNANLTRGQKISVNYRAYDRATGKEIDLKQNFSSITESVTYNSATYTVGTEFAVVEGRNEITVTVNIMNGKYMLYGSIFCNIERNPTDFRVEYSIKGNHNDNPMKSRVMYTVYVDNKEVGIGSLKALHFDYRVDVYDDIGNIYPAEINEENGKATVVVDVSGGKATAYYVKMTVESDSTVSPRDARMRESICEIRKADARVEGVFTDKVDGNDQKGRAEFTLYINNSAVTPEELARYSWEISAKDPMGNDFPNKSSTSGGRIIAEVDTSGEARGEYKIELKVSLLAGEPLTTEISFSRYPKSLDLKPIANDLSSLSQYDLLNNTKGVAFELYADGLPISFDDPIIKYTLLFGDDDVSTFADIEGSIIRYAPRESHIKTSYRVPGEKKITLIASCPLGNTGDVTSEAKFELTKTVYSIEAVSILNKEVNRFDIDSADAGVYFRLLRDGVPLTASEVHAIYDGGEFNIALPFAMRFFLLPVGADIGVEDENGESLIYCKPIRDQAGFFAFFTSMLIFNGNKNITATYREASATDYVIFSPNSFWQYFVRILLLALIIYTIIYIIGFFTHKTFPRGVFVSVSEGIEKISVAKKAINISIIKIMLWHIKRFFLGALRHQTPIKVPGGKLKMSKDGRMMFMFYADEVKTVRRARQFAQLDDFLHNVKRRRVGEIKRLRIGDGDHPVTWGIWRGKFTPVGHYIAKRDGPVGFEDTYYAVYNREHTIKRYVFFAKR